MKIRTKLTRTRRRTIYRVRMKDEGYVQRLPCLR